MSALAEDRLVWLERRLAADGAVTIAGAAAALDVSEMTIRRDLTELEERGAARRVRGGARAVGPQAFSARTQVAARAKARIATKLADLVPAVGAVALDASSTVLRLANGLDTRDLTVLTNGPDTFAALQGRPGVTALLTGGRLDPQTGSLVGPLAARAAQQLVVDTFFASAAALGPDGAYEATLDEAEVKRAVIADRTVLAADATKLDRRAAALGLEWHRVDVLVTELDPTDPRLDPYRDLADLR